MNKIECKYCKNMFLCKTTLITHQKTAKYCLSKRGKTTVYVCISCNKILSSEHRLQTHYNSCMKYQKTEIRTELIKELNKDNDILRIQLEQLEERLTQKDEHIKELESKLENIALKAVSRPINTTNNQVNINNYMQKMDCVTDKYLIDQIPKLTIEHIKKGPQGYAEYALKYPLNNRILCVDYARRKVKYKDKDGNVITDPEMNNISSKLFQGIKDKNASLIMGYLNSLDDDLDTEEKLKIMGVLSDYMIMVNNGARGDKNELYHEFVKNVCSKTIVD
jgi:hypothetical protein